MPGTKRKASFAFPYERPSKLSKRSSSTTVSRTLSTITKRRSVVKPPQKMPTFPSLRASKMDAIAEVSASAPVPEVGCSPALRRASTLTLENDGKGDSRKTTLTKLKASASKPASLSKKSSSFVEEGALVTNLSGLRSGSIVGETSLVASTSLTKGLSVPKSLSRKSSSVTSTDSSSKIPSVPRGLTRHAPPKGGSKSGSLRISKSSLLSDIDETEMSSALETLKTQLSKEGSTKRSMSKSVSVRSTSSVKETTATKRSMSKSVSVRSTSSVKEITETDTGEDMDTSTAGPSSDGLMEVAISFDTTGSMYGCLEEVRAKVQDLVQRLQTDIPGIRVAVIAHGDYCDESNYVIKWIDFGATLPEICDFVKTVGRTGGGDGPECYELVLQRSREVLSWTNGSKRILVMIGDDVPHEPGYTYGGKTYNINWRDECAALKEMGVKVYGVQAGCSLGAAFFNDNMARITGGKRLSLKNFSSIFDVLMMICYREGNPEMLAVYEQEIIERGERMNEDITSLKKTFDTASSATIPIANTLTPFCAAGFGIGAGGIGLSLAPTSTPFGAAGFGMGAGPAGFGRGAGATGFGLAPTSSPFGVAGFGMGPGAAGFGIGAGATGFGSAPTLTPFGAAGFGMGTGAAGFGLAPTSTLFGGTGFGTGAAGIKTFKPTTKKREKLPDSFMSQNAMKDFTWSKWICGIEPNMPTSKQKSNFVKLRTNQGYGPKTIFYGNLKVPAIYEIAVQLPGGRKKYVVYFRILNEGLKQGGFWATNLLRDKLVRQEVNNVLNQGCSIYIRRGKPKATTTDAVRCQMQTAVVTFRENYDYAWIKYIWRAREDREAKFKLNHRLLKLTRKRETFILADNKI